MSLHKLFLDSGAFSAWSQKKEIRIKDYIQFIKAHQKSIHTYANLDVIGDSEKTFQNQLIMEKHGLTPLPVFHYGEDERYLTKYLDRGYEYMALGGMVPISTPQLTQWLDRLFEGPLTDTKGMPRLKLHGFGLTSVYLMSRYPWFSVDSTTWMAFSNYGSVIYPLRKNGQWDYSNNYEVINVSPRPSTKKISILYSCTHEVNKVFLKYIEEKGFVLGKSVWEGGKEIIIEPGLCNDVNLRYELCALYFLDLIKTLPEYPWAFKKRSRSQLQFF